MIQTQVVIRAATSADGEAVRAFLAGLSTNAQYQRFFTGLGSVSPSLVRELVTVSPRQHVLLALHGFEVIGHAMASATRDNESIELGVVIAEAHRRGGVATRLMRTLIEHAILTGTDRLRLDVLCENQLVLDWIRHRLPDTTFERDGHTLTGYTTLSPALLASGDDLALAEVVEQFEEPGLGVDELVEAEPARL